MGATTCGCDYNGVGSEAIEGLRFLASCPLAGTGWREGGEKTQPLNRLQSCLGTEEVVGL